MSLRHALLGLLAYEPASGYDLAKEFAGELGRYAWQATHTQIYPELAKLDDEGLIEVAETGPRGRRTYAITEAGRAELRSWLLQPPTGSAVRNEPVLRMFLLSSLDRDDAREYLAGAAKACQEELNDLRAILDDGDRDRPADKPLPFGRLAGEFGVRFYEMTRDWALWALEQVDRGKGKPTPEPSDPATR